MSGKYKRLDHLFITICGVCPSYSTGSVDHEKIGEPPKQISH